MSQRNRRPAPKQPPRRQPARQAQQAQPRRPFLTPHASPFRTAVERRSAVVVVFLRKLPRLVPGLLVIGIVATGLLAPPVAGGVALLVAALLLAWLAFLTWPAMPAPGRILRLAVVAMVVAYAIVRFLGGGTR